MNFGHFARAAGHAIKGLGLALALSAAPHVASAAAPAAAAPVAAAPAGKAAAPAADAKAAAAPVAAPAAVAAAPAIDPNDPHFKVAPGGYTPMKPTAGKGMPIPGAIDIQHQYSPNGNVAVGLHNWLVIVMAVIALFVLVLLAIVILRFNKRANPVPSKTSHNTMLEVAWTAIPVLVLVVIAVPSL
ncbi:MAG: cytochrome c oxidase subunit II transmembrane domain-containing protein, partial [Novosphingobium sp.]